MVSIDYVAPNVVQYNYILEQIDKDDPRVKSVSQVLKAALIEDLKKNDGMSVFRENKVDLIYVYKDTDNNEVFKVRLNHGEY